MDQMKEILHDAGLKQMPDHPAWRTLLLRQSLIGEYRAVNM